ncbi:hypothetical protein P153DRAFT_364334 [Dothidotthia symphoricarpi CBS 119687]|uniref:Uncharacterized protein n=1 Tax=Dothidotthia symphoricarpi CBS 119687 TaxID=1392245 RepID=A0A6A6ALP2_9PLEO|nr:uncharacterized protein P153DRAFT_364334 [Dothidotthia symphoricarpi CBS 119687]KAF2131854.1 hypothetical protein P153DRAFT_364334 [Dothidotthia symphoricarpi CBS 119687]
MYYHATRTPPYSPDQPQFQVPREIQLRKPQPILPSMPNEVPSQRVRREVSGFRGRNYPTMSIKK